MLCYLTGLSLIRQGRVRVSKIKIQHFEKKTEPRIQFLLMTANHKVLHIQQTFTITFDAEYNHNYISLSAHLSDFVKGFIEIKILCRYCKPLALVRVTISRDYNQLGVTCSAWFPTSFSFPPPPIVCITVPFCQIYFRSFFLSIKYYTIKVSYVPFSNPMSLCTPP